MLIAETLDLIGGKLDEVIADFTEALKLDPKSVRALAGRSVIDLYRKELDRAAKDIAALEVLNPRNAMVWIAKGFRSGDFNIIRIRHMNSIQSPSRWIPTTLSRSPIVPKFHSCGTRVRTHCEM